MRVSREQAAGNRARIVTAASQLFREHGFDGVGVDAIMKAAGLTHGGFYGHFGSKDDLVTEAVELGLAESTEKQAAQTSLEQLVTRYLSEGHRADVARGCLLAAIGGDMARQGEGVRHVVTDYVRGQIARISEFFAGSRDAQRQQAITTLSGLVGAMILARAVDDSPLSDEILGAARDALGNAGRKTPPF